MNKSELIERVSEATDIARAPVSRIIETFLETIMSQVGAGNAVTLPGFGTFKPVHRAARQGLNPATGERLEIAARVTPKFTPGSKFKAEVSESEPA